MLIDITLMPEDAFQITRHASGKVTLTMPVDLLVRTHAAYILQKPRFDSAQAQAEAHH